MIDKVQHELLRTQSGEFIEETNPADVLEGARIRMRREEKRVGRRIIKSVLFLLLVFVVLVLVTFLE